jgi:mannonate dehydratase
MSAIAAVDTALWDIKGKVAGLPLYQLLGGASREGVMVYGHANGTTIEETVERALEYQSLGYKAIRAQCGIPGIEHAYGIASGEAPDEPATKGKPLETVWSSEAYLSFVPSVFERLRREFGSGLHLLHDVHHRLTPIEAARFGKEVEDCRLFWMEDPTPAENQEAFRLIRRHTTTPIATGEILNSIWDVQQLITEQLIDYVRTTVVHAGGITHLKRIFDLAALYHVRSGSHGATDLSPVTLAAAVHLDLVIPNFGIQEYMAHADDTNEVFRTHVHLEDGLLDTAEVPGLGVEYDEKAAARFPYEPRYLPVARRLDGSVHGWRPQTTRHPEQRS